MNVFRKVTLESLKKNKTRTLVTILGVIVSTAMFSAVTSSIASFQNFMIENTAREYGSWHTRSIESPYSYYEEAIEDEKYTSVNAIQNIGFAPYDREDIKYLSVMGIDDINDDTYAISVTDGRIPENANEIILPSHQKSQFEIGQKITLPVGERIGDDGLRLGRNQYISKETDRGFVVPDWDRETFVPKETREYTVVGFFDATYIFSFWGETIPAYTVMEGSPVEGYSYDIYYKYADPSLIPLDTANGVEEGNFMLLKYLGVFGREEVTTMVELIGVIVMLLIFFASSSLIYNAFSISVSERTKQYGLLLSLGASKKQIRKTVLYEASVISLIGIPIGVISGIAGMAVTFLFIGDKLTVFGFDIPLRMHLSVGAMIVAGVISYLTAMISAWIPSKRAMKINPIEAIRQSDDIKKPKTITKTPDFVYNIFGFPGLIADKNYKRSKRKYRATVVSLTMSIILFISTASFVDQMMRISRARYDVTDLSYVLSGRDEDLNGISRDEVLNKLMGVEGVEKACYTTSVSGYFQLNPKRVVNGLGRLNANVLFVNDEEFIKLARENNLDKDIYFDKTHPVGIISDEVMTIGDSGAYYKTNLINGDEFAATFEGDTQRFYGKGKVTTKPYYVDRGMFYLQDVTLIYPMSMMEFALGEMFIYDDIVEYNVCAGVSLENIRRIDKMLNDYGIELYGWNVNEDTIAERNLVFVMQVCCYGFITLISIVAAANVFNTISTNVILRRREFAMFKSVGMGKKDFNKMMIFECLLYGVRSIMWGLPIALVFTVLINKVFNIGYDLAYPFPFEAVLFAVLNVFIIVFISMIYSVKKVNKDNIIETLRNENI